MKTYKVGHGKPPKHTRFKKGHTGNPKGRPKKSDLGGDPVLDRVLKQKIPIRVNGQAKRLTTREAMYQTMAVKGIQGDTKAATSILAIDERQRKQKQPEEPQNIEEDELEILRRHFTRIQKLVAGDV